MEIFDSLLTFCLEDMESTERKNYKVLLGCTGSVASCKALPLVKLLKAIQIENYGVEVQVVATKNALPFMQIDRVKELCAVYTNTHVKLHPHALDPNCYEIPILWADLFLIAPIGANTLAKVANGLCDNLLTYIVRAWDFQKPLLFCPAMNTHMWEHSITANHVSMLKKFGFIEIPCVSKHLACGDVGFGGMAEITTISHKITEVLCALNKE